MSEIKKAAGFSGVMKDAMMLTDRIQLMTAMQSVLAEEAIKLLDKLDDNMNEKGE